MFIFPSRKHSWPPLGPVSAAGGVREEVQTGGAHGCQSAEERPWARTTAARGCASTSRSRRLRSGSRGTAPYSSFSRCWGFVWASGISGGSRTFVRRMEEVSSGKVTFICPCLWFVCLSFFHKDLQRDNEKVEIVKQQCLYGNRSICMKDKISKRQNKSSKLKCFFLNFERMIL